MYSGYSLFTLCSFDNNKNKHDFYKSQGSMKNFCLDLRKHTTEIINFEKNEMLPVAMLLCHICKEESYDINATKN